VGTIRGAVASGDNAAIQVAAAYAMAWHGENPASLARAFRNDGGTLLKMFALANQLSSASTTQSGIRERTLKTFSSPTAADDEEGQAAYDRLAAEYGSDGVLATMVAVWKNNRESGKDFGKMLGSSPDSPEQVYLSPFFLSALRDQFRGYLEDSGGNVAAATRMVESTMSTAGVSRLGTVPSPLMAHCPEDYPGIMANKESMTHALESAGRKWYDGAVASGDIPEGAEYVGTFLLSDDITDSKAEDLDSNAFKGIDYTTSGDGSKFFCPSYVHGVTFSLGGLVHSVPIGRFTPSPDGAAEMGGMP
jgi:hypothetical protein